LKGFLQKGSMEINNNKQSAVADGCLVSQVIPFDFFFLPNVKISPVGQSNSFITSYPQTFSLILCLHNRFVVSPHLVTVLSDV